MRDNDGTTVATDPGQKRVATRMVCDMLTQIKRKKAQPDTALSARAINRLRTCRANAKVLAGKSVLRGRISNQSPFFCVYVPVGLGGR